MLSYYIAYFSLEMFSEPYFSVMLSYNMRKSPDGFGVRYGGKCVRVRTTEETTTCWPDSLCLCGKNTDKEDNACLAENLYTVYPPEDRHY